MSGAGFGTNLNQLRFRKTAACNRHLSCLVDALRRSGTSKAANERVGGVSYQSIENEIWPAIDDLPYDTVKIGFANREVAFSQDIAASSLDGFPHDLVVFPSPNVIRTNAVTRVATVP